MGTLDMVIDGLWAPQVALHLLGLSSLICQMGSKQAPHDREEWPLTGCGSVRHRGPGLSAPTQSKGPENSQSSSPGRVWTCPVPGTRLLCKASVCLPHPSGQWRHRRCLGLQLRSLPHLSCLEAVSGPRGDFS